MHIYFEPILKRLYENKDKTETIEISDLLDGTDVQKDEIALKLEKSKLAGGADSNKIALCKHEFKTFRYYAKITSLGIIYYEKFIKPDSAS